ncbi:archaea-specific SMC-related protein [Halomarina halobia]|uniref:Archaea-specific SMC-related protein n=1 Tax=Halomarina halobia TaxID=3033386 RepID=A0ABD6AD58_9EURY|nr:archaea-specific SMC-related protein [Halomarina sp. PSR21]
MKSPQIVAEEVTVDVRNVGGITETDVTFSPGVTILRGRNATNRTSLLQALMAGLGSTDVSLKGDADEGAVELTVDGETYRRTLRREGSAVAFEGDAYLDDPTTAELFAFLLENNEARRTVARGDDLHDIIMRPVDTDEIEAEIDRLETEKRRLDDELDAIESLDDELGDLEAEREELKRRIEAKREELEGKEAEIEAADADIKQSRQEQSALEETLGKLSEARSALETARFDSVSERESIDALEAERDELETELAELPDEPEATGDLETRQEQLRARQRSLEQTINELQSIVQFNREMVEGTATDVTEALADDEGPVTDRLLDGDTTVCWTCGTEVDVDQVETTIDRLQSLRKEKLNERNAVRSELREVKERLDGLEARRGRRERLENRLSRIEDELDRRRDRLETLESRREEQEARIEDLEAAVEEQESEDYSTVLALHREANELEFELGQLESDLEETADRIDTLESRLDERERLEREREAVSEELTDLRTRIETLETRAVEQFNEHMATVLDLLEYANLDRIWLERTERTVREGRRKVESTVFELHVVRTTESGTAYEDTIDHLSESEREVTGLVFALAGYLVHDVYETCPFMLLDSLEAIDADRIARLVDYFESQAEFLVVALLPEDAQALDDGYRRIDEI